MDLHSQSQWKIGANETYLGTLLHRLTPSRSSGNTSWMSYLSAVATAFTGITDENAMSKSKSVRMENSLSGQESRSLVPHQQGEQSLHYELRSETGCIDRKSSSAYSGTLRTYRTSQNLGESSPWIERIAHTRRRAARDSR